MYNHGKLIQNKLNLSDMKRHLFVVILITGVESLLAIITKKLLVRVPMSLVPMSPACVVPCC